MSSGLKRVIVEYANGRKAVFRVEPKGNNSVYLYETRPRLEVIVDYIVPKKKVREWKPQNTRKPR